MKRPIILSLFLLAALAACRIPQQPPAGATGAEIYRLQACSNCHGGDGQGRHHGPPLADLSSRWTRDSLAAFIADPDAFEARDARLAALAEEYPGDMEAYDNLSTDERLRLADFLLSL